MFSPSSALQAIYPENKNPNLLFNSGGFTLDELVIGKLVDDRIGNRVEFHEGLDLHDLYVLCTIGQSIHRPYIALTIHLGESKSVFERFGSKGLQGEEFVRIKFQTPTRDIIEQIFYVTGYEPVKQTEHELGNAILLHCVSKEKLINDILSVNKSFTNVALHETAKDIITNTILNNEQYKTLAAAVGPSWKIPEWTSDEAIGTQSFIIPGLTPFGAMRFLARRGFGGSEFKGSMYTFFENNKGYHFRNLETIIKEDIAAADIPNFTYDQDMNAQPRNSIGYFRNIQAISPFKTSNTLDKIGSGAFNNTVRTIDYIKKKHFDTNFSMLDEYEGFKRVGNKSNITDAFFNRFCQEPTDFTIIKDTTEPKDNFELMVGKRKAYIEFLSTFGCQIVVYGDTNLNVGQMINLDFMETTSKELRESSIYGGVYFISNLVHSFDKEKFNTTLSLAKDSLDKVHTEGG